MLWEVLIPVYSKDGKDWNEQPCYRIRWKKIGEVLALTPESAMSSARKMNGIAPIVCPKGSVREAEVALCSLSY